jgi:hypothetical protein
MDLQECGSNGSRQHRTVHDGQKIAVLCKVYGIRKTSKFSRHALVVRGMASRLDRMLNGNQNHGLLLLVRNAL